MMRQRGWKWMLWMCVCAAPLFGPFLVHELRLRAEEASENSPVTPSRDENKPVEPRPLFSDWPDPQLALFITGRQNGYIEPCGCTGLANQKGGLARRHSLYQQLIERGWNLLPIDVGNQVRRLGRQQAIKFQTTMEAFRVMEYAAVALGPDDLRLDITELLSAIGIEGEPGPLISSNASVLNYNAGFKVVRRDPYVIGIVACLGSEEAKLVKNDEIELSSPEDGIRKSLAELKKQGCNLQILLAQASLDETKQLAKAFPDSFQVIITSGGGDEPELKPERIEGSKSYLIQTGKKGMYVGVLGFFAGKEGQSIRYERIPLDNRFSDSASMLRSFAAYQQQLKNLGLSGLEVRPIKHPTGNQFVGSQACQPCHEDAFQIWKDSPHAHATDGIAKPTERSTIPRHYDPECLSCHVTGWHPQNYFPYISGYVSHDGSAHLHGNGCENCHGPGSAHVAAEEGRAPQDSKQLAALREQLHLTLEGARDVCLSCHDLDNDPDFQKEGAFETYWEQIAH